MWFILGWIYLNTLLKISLENIVFAIFIQTQPSLMHFIVFSYKYITTTKSKIKAYKSPPASRILQAASRSSFCLCAMAKEKNSFWRSFFHPCAMRGQDDVSALKARRMKIRGTQPQDWRSPLWGFCLLSGDVGGSGLEGKEGPSVHSSSATCGHHSVIPDPQKQQWELGAMVSSGEKREDEVTRSLQVPG